MFTRQQAFDETNSGLKNTREWRSKRGIRGRLCGSGNWRRGDGSNAIRQNSQILNLSAMRTKLKLSLGRSWRRRKVCCWVDEKNVKLIYWTSFTRCSTDGFLKIEEMRPPLCKKMNRFMQMNFLWEAIKSHQDFFARNGKGMDQFEEIALKKIAMGWLLIATRRKRGKK